MIYYILRYWVYSWQESTSVLATQWWELKLSVYHFIRLVNGRISYRLASASVHLKSCFLYHHIPPVPDAIGFAHIAIEPLALRPYITTLGSCSISGNHYCTRKANTNLTIHRSYYKPHKHISVNPTQLPLSDYIPQMPRSMPMPPNRSNSTTEVKSEWKETENLTNYS